MRIIAGKAGRMSIKVPQAVTRPTTDFVRQAMFSILGDLVTGARVADLFAGSGALGLEALSRGARSCIFVDQSPQAVRVLKENVQRTELHAASIVSSDVLTWLKRDRGSYDLVFADPPYVKSPLDVNWIARLLQSGDLLARLADDGIFYAEISKQTATPEHANWTLVDRRHYGSSAILLYRPQQPAVIEADAIK